MQRGYELKLRSVRSLALLRVDSWSAYARTSLRPVPAPRPEAPPSSSAASSQVGHEHYPVPMPKRCVTAAARKGKRQKASDGPSTSQAGPADATQLLQALTQLASRVTIIVGSHQAHALMDSLEPQLPQQLPRIPDSTLASGLWAMTRLQMQPSEELISAVAQHLMKSAPANSNNNSKQSTNNLLTLDTRTLGSLIYGLNFFRLRDPAFWAAAAAVAVQQQHIRALKPAAVSNLLQGLASSGWSTTADLALLSTQQGNKTVEASAVERQKRHDQQQMVARLLQAVEQLLLSEPERLSTWRMRDISQLCQSYALMAWDCVLLFAAVANHLLQCSPPPQSSPPASAHRHTCGSRSDSLAAPSWLQQQQQQWIHSNAAVDAYSEPQYQQFHRGVAAPPSNAPSRLQSYHYRGRGPGRLAECRASDIAGLAWAFVATWCTNQVLLQELAAVMTLKAGQLHAADCSRLLWAYTTAGVTDMPMLTAVTASVAEEMCTVYPRTAASCVWSLAIMGFEAPAFMEVALDRLATCLEATAVHSPGADVAAELAPVTPAATGSVTATVSAGNGGMVTATGQPAAASRSAAVGGISVLQQLCSHPPAAYLSGGPEVGPATRPNAEELSLLSMMHRRTTRHRDQQRQHQHEQHVQQRQPVQVSLQQEQHVEQEQQDEYDPAQLLHLQPHEHMSSQAGHSRDRYQQQQQQQQPPLLGTYWQWQQQHEAGRADAADLDSVDCTPRDVAQAVYACGRLQHYNASFFSVVRLKFLGLLPRFSDSELVQVLWGLARLNLYDGNNMDAAAAELITRVSRFPGPLLGITAWSYASLKHAHVDLFTALARRACELAKLLQLKPLDANQLVRAAAKMCFRDEPMFQACALVLQKALPRLGDSMVVSSLWGFAVAGFFDGVLCTAGYRRISQLPVSKARPLLLLQLFQAATLTQDSYSIAGLTSPVSLPSALSLAAKRQWMFSNRRSSGSSKSNFQTAVVHVLRDALGLAVDEEVLTEDGLFSIDAAVTWKARRVAVEVDGPSHFTNNAPYQLLGSCVAKQRCLQARGWVVLSVPFYRWNSMAGGNKQQHAQQQQQQRRRRQQKSSETHRTNNSCGSLDLGPAQVLLVSDGSLSARAEFLEAELDHAIAVAGLPVGLQQADGVLLGM